jgi:hypothetical protein
MDEDALNTSVRKFHEDTVSASRPVNLQAH